MRVRRRESVAFIGTPISTVMPGEAGHPRLAVFPPIRSTTESAYMIDEPSTDDPEFIAKGLAVLLSRRRADEFVSSAKMDDRLVCMLARKRQAHEDRR